MWWFPIAWIILCFLLNETYFIAIYIKIISNIKYTF